MSVTVFLQKDPANIIYRWLSLTDQGKTETIGAGSLSDAAEFCTSSRTVLIVPGTEVLLSQITIPTRNRQRLLKAIPYAMEDQLVDEVENIHFAITDGIQAGATPVCAISRNTLSVILQELASVNIQPAFVVPVNLCIPYTPGTWSVLLEDRVATFRTGPFSGFLADSHNLYQLTQIALSEAENLQPDKIVIYDNRCSDDYSTKPVQEEIGTIPVEVIWVEESIELLASNFDDRNTINLLQGEYSPHRQRDRLWRNWRPAAAVLCALIAIEFLSTLFYISDYKRQSTELKQRVEQVFKQALPDAKRVSYVRERMTQRLQQLKTSSAYGQSGFLQLLGTTSEILKKHNSTGLVNIQYRNGIMDIELTLRNLQSLDKLKQDLTKTGIEVDIRSASTDGSQVVSRLRLTGKNK